LANLDRCWTADRLARHGLQHHPRCLLCDQARERSNTSCLTAPFLGRHGMRPWPGYAYRRRSP
uniref:Reverse transcriptase zinc-binding domain-containing protein n=1 Tax=Aegilops tauschii subsp. strangulata TaxID=200361 RepID=A0A453RBX0_AEGTS